MSILKNIIHFYVVSAKKNLKKNFQHNYEGQNILFSKTFSEHIQPPNMIKQIVINDSLMICYVMFRDSFTGFFENKVLIT